MDIQTSCCIAIQHFYHSSPLYYFFFFVESPTGASYIQTRRFCVILNYLNWKLVLSYYEARVAILWRWLSEYVVGIVWFHYFNTNGYMKNTITRLNYCIKFTELGKQSSNYVHKSALIHFLTNNENNTKMPLWNGTETCLYQIISRTLRIWSENTCQMKFNKRKVKAVFQWNICGFPLHRLQMPNIIYFKYVPTSVH